MSNWSSDVALAAELEIMLELRNAEVSPDSISENLPPVEDLLFYYPEIFGLDWVELQQTQTGHGRLNCVFQQRSRSLYIRAWKELRFCHVYGDVVLIFRLFPINRESNPHITFSPCTEIVHDNGKDPSYLTQNTIATVLISADRYQHAQYEVDMDVTRQIKLLALASSRRWL
ncbi:hypothetical protein P175DRAFT_0533504 [Aspergillus ochraceoroseus IBT 24754]|uniref:Uncharacterized protein n=1 Tax=Aspergillus ochraceoroseus IBT 24754 TaxID=1392256 RepID=A0A2T5LS30_9EURO|nr:uncharacterized protein P175DRAFT_0533504 [Aspergillus ochraceoroseus IBT 24754]PTU19084.1 hypothetical protein P175DRAFT_0533504 [Aspergillus ochraceoroseus IBT 24754]